MRGLPQRTVSAAFIGNGTAFKARPAELSGPKLLHGQVPRSKGRTQLLEVLLEYPLLELEQRRVRVGSRTPKKSGHFTGSNSILLIKISSLEGLVG